MAEHFKRLALGILLASCVLAAPAAPPGFESLYPAGGQVGSTVEVSVAGKDLDKGSPVLWASHPGVVFKAGDKPKKFKVTIAPDVPPGPCLVRFHTAEGSSPPRIFEVGKAPEFLEKEPNDAFADAKAAEARSDAVINGVLEKSGDVDTHAIRVKKGRGVTLEVHGYALGSPMDPALRLLDARGVEVAGGHDTHNLDPRIEYTPTADGVMYAQIFAFAHPPAADVSLKGGGTHVYRLLVAEDAPPQPDVAEPARIAIPGSISGVLAKSGEEDFFTFTAQKGQELLLAARSRRFDAALRVEDSDHKALATSDDGESGTTDASLRWKAPKDGDFSLVVFDRDRGHGPRHRYEAAADLFQPSLTAVLDTHAYRLEAGKSVELKLALKVTGSFTGKITAKALELPAGVTCDPAEAAAKNGELKLTLKAAPVAASSQAPFRIELVVDGKTFAATFTVPFTEPRGELLISTDAHPWLSVAAAKAK